MGATSTLAAVGGAQIPKSDGFNMWSYIIFGGESPRPEVPLNIDTCVGLTFGGPPCARGEKFNGLISGRWKLINNNGESTYDGWWTNDPYVKSEPNATEGPVKFDGEEKVW